MTFFGEAAMPTGRKRTCSECGGLEREWKGEKTGSLVWLCVFGCSGAGPSDG